MQESNYIFIELNRYGAEDSSVYIITKTFLDKWLKFRKKMQFTEAPIAKLKHNVRAQDEEEISLIWLPTQEQPDKASIKFMKEIEEEMQEEGFEL